MLVHDDLQESSVGVESTDDCTSRTVAFASGSCLLLEGGNDGSLGDAPLIHTFPSVGEDLRHITPQAVDSLLGSGLVALSRRSRRC